MDVSCGMGASPDLETGSGVATGAVGCGPPSAGATSVPKAYTRRAKKHIPRLQAQVDPVLVASDEFRMYCYKVVPCSIREAHEWTTCPFCHPGEMATRRCPQQYSYTALACPDLKGGCPRKESCIFSHSLFEYWLHPTRYHTQLCSYGSQCRRSICFFAHHCRELRDSEELVQLQAIERELGLEPSLGFQAGSGSRWGRQAAPNAKGKSPTMSQQQQQQQQQMTQHSQQMDQYLGVRGPAPSLLQNLPSCPVAQHSLMGPQGTVGMQRVHSVSPDVDEQMAAVMTLLTQLSDAKEQQLQQQAFSLSSRTDVLPVKQHPKDQPWPQWPPVGSPTSVAWTSSASSSCPSASQQQLWMDLVPGKLSLARCTGSGSSSVNGMQSTAASITSAASFSSAFRGNSAIEKGGLQKSSQNSSTSSFVRLASNGSLSESSLASQRGSPSPVAPSLSPSTSLQDTEEHSRLEEHTLGSFSLEGGSANLGNGPWKRQIELAPSKFDLGTISELSPSLAQLSELTHSMAGLGPISGAASLLNEGKMVLGVTDLITSLLHLAEGPSTAEMALEVEELELLLNKLSNKQAGFKLPSVASMNQL